MRDPASAHDGAVPVGSAVCTTRSHMIRTAPRYGTDASTPNSTDDLPDRHGPSATAAGTVTDRRRTRIHRMARGGEE
jgi:hypothetical protein